MSEQTQSPLWGGICILIGAYILLASLDVFSTLGVDAGAPRWVLVSCSIATTACGVALCTKPRSVIRRICVTVILIGMAITGIWASLLSPSHGISGGIPFVPRSVNVGLGRLLFGLGALVCLLLLIPLWRSVGKRTGD